jgi:L-arabinose transport system ATP-binding protein
LPVPVNFEVRAGEITGFFGLIGAGRSEMSRLIYGADPRRTGKVSVEGRMVAADDPRSSIRAGIVLCPEDRKFDGIVQGRSIEENIAISARRHFSPLGLIRPKKEAELAETYITKLRVRTPSRKQDIVNLSGGNQQKVILGRWLAEQNIKVLIIDEPTRGIDVGAKAEIYEILYQLAESGMAIVVISSELPEVMGISDRIMVMCEGQIAASFERVNFNDRAILKAALPDKTVSEAAAGSLQKVS